VFLLGIKNNPYKYIKNADLIVQSSRYEGKSLVLDEAKILLKPIIATKYDSVTDQIEDRETGILVDINPEGIAKGVEEILGNIELRNILIKNLSHKDFSMVE